MKQLFYATGMLMLFVSGQVSAQKNETAFVSRSSIFNSPFLSKASVLEPAAAAKVIVAMSAAERFKRDFKDAKNVEWVVIANGFRAYFVQDAILTAVDYTQKGRLYSIIRYGKDVLPKDVQKLIDRSFDGPVVVEASEVKIAEYAGKVSIVVLEDRLTMKTVQIIDDEVEVISEISK